MRLDSLLAELRDNILYDRTDEISGTTSRLWTDDTLIRYINEACRRFARRALVIRDGSTPAVTQITLATDQAEYVLHPSVMAVISAKLTEENYDMGRVGHATLAGYRLPSSAMSYSADLSESPGRPVAFSTDERLATDTDGSTSRMVLRVYPVPSVDYNAKTVDLRVIRMPIEDLTKANMKAEPEIPEEHHIEMLDWAAYLALRISDTDAGNPKAAKDFANSFEAHVLSAKKEALRKLFAPSPWGFGRGGWTWERDYG